MKTGVTGEQIWLQINEPTPQDKGKYTMELFDGKTGHKKTVDLSGQGRSFPLPHLCVGVTLWLGRSIYTGSSYRPVTLWVVGSLCAPQQPGSVCGDSTICFPWPVLSGHKLQTAFSSSKYPLAVCLLRYQPSFWAILQTPLCHWHWLAVLNTSCSTECLVYRSLPSNIWRRKWVTSLFCYFPTAFLWWI